MPGGNQPSNLEFGCRHAPSRGVADSSDKVKVIQARLLTTQSRQKSHTDRRVRDLVFLRVGDVTYELALPPGLSSIHQVFHVSMLKKYVSDGSHVIRWDSVMLDENLSYEEESIAILDRQIRKLRPKEIASLKVQWRGRPVDI
ncbi:uncharacterized protein LOC132042714 [Lycium ferocissimum]|uniref:uncharacterized protein LOC132042714 n=1 Tax=Lycium ferocissimum TaxID=112874 RepID=UPI0028164D02|nr:uncharacterized protein LOC132042714 [Lycium ferocissimum]